MSFPAFSVFGEKNFKIKGGEKRPCSTLMSRSNCNYRYETKRKGPLLSFQYVDFQPLRWGFS